MEKHENAPQPLYIDVRVRVNFRVAEDDTRTATIADVKRSLTRALDDICNPDRSDSGATVWVDTGTIP